MKEKLELQVIETVPLYLNDVGHQNKFVLYFLI